MSWTAHLVEIAALYSSVASRRARSLTSREAWPVAMTARRPRTSSRRRPIGDHGDGAGGRLVGRRSAWWRGWKRPCYPLRQLSRDAAAGRSYEVGRSDQSLGIERLLVRTHKASCIAAIYIP